MPSIGEIFGLCCGACRIGCYTLYVKLCCKSAPSQRQEYQLICLGLSKAGKTTLLTMLCGEKADDIQPTQGFNIKAIPFKEAILNVKEIGGQENVRPFWNRYYDNIEGIVFIIDSSCSPEEFLTVKEELHKVLGHASLKGLPILILANYQDQSSARKTDQIIKDFDLDERAAGRKWLVHPCSYADVESARDGLQRLLYFLKGIEVKEDSARI
ncbi:ADP-ribosylation factor-like protein 15 [Saccoglossus kowalevskii]|uniref:ADP-ribosylation factor-like protein 15-like n=1 Tax=Saccoglossus kowalevskii TaxID=10224 RepID=A0ABM0GSY3_SACKO|nr:PREDICTED: ADP-ribosylation factor-like protein 15-like [Saccoglossus kowalevskii]